MSEKLFEDAEVGDKVWDFRYGWGIVQSIINVENTRYPLRIYFNSVERITITFNSEGKSDNQSNQTLFWNEFKVFEPRYTYRYNYF
jgi:hypothetical protein